METQPISLTEAKKFLRLEYTDEDDYIKSLIKTSREICESFMRKPIDCEACPERVRQAMFLLVGHFYENRETDNNRELPKTVYNLLLPLREPRW